MSSAARSVEILEVQRSDEIDALGLGDLHALFHEGDLMVRGWAIGREAAATAAKISGIGFSFEAQAPIRLSRPDVTLAVGDEHPGSDTPGFVFELSPRGTGTSAFNVLVEFADGEITTLGTVVAEVRGDSSSGSDVGWTHRGIPAERRKVVVGKEGWLFLKRDTNDVIGQHTGHVRLAEEELKAWRAVLEERTRAAAELETQWLCSVIPDKEAVYAEHLPDEITPAARRTVHQLLDLADEADAPLVYTLDALLRAKDQGDLYAKTDTHWNQRGAFVVYQFICHTLKEQGLPVEILDEDAVRWSSETVQGDLGAKLYPEEVSSELIRSSLTEQQKDPTFDNRVLNHGRVIIFERENKDLPSCVVFGESFAKNLLTFLQASFRRLTFVHTSMWVREIVELEQPDVVLSIPVERFLLRVPSDDEAFARLRRTALKKGGQLPWLSGLAAK